MNMIFKKFLPVAVAGAFAMGIGTVSAAPLTKLGKDLTDEERERVSQMVQGAPLPKDEELVHIPPTMEDLEASDLHPKMKEAIRRGHDLFVNTQQLRGKNVFNNMNCSSCHMAEGTMPYGGPVWPAAIDLPAYRGKNGHVNNLEERIVGCFTYSMNGKPLEYGSDDMLALSLYHQWLATGVPMFAKDKIYGRGFPRPGEPENAPDAVRGKVAYEANCAICHGEDGAGKKDGDKVIFPALWGDDSYNWGAGIARVFTLAGFTKHNMPLGKPNSLSDQDAWDIAQYVDSRERPQDPRYTGDIKETREMYLDTFHKHTLYGTEMDGKILGDHDNAGHKDFLKPEILRSRDFTGGKKAE
ncbi:MAG TPA: c-type cytochrome [Paenalcaligenes hominis]|uniref:C-type cytochrome n=1 Tax=Paenalcaligenes hominis TaxID=643674 RepID=A0A9D2VH75_9BURK|nr:c-type cytochrome [Paenalcaligenes hominis]NJB64057.1 thiosulfate dehydrogenase [Paenalcaligenes hominis]GGE62777.1 cytochrome c [Paenalcaligenes hominis]HJH24494.1 c-type cytochrome [Paenalcaligenes hominis]